MMQKDGTPDQPGHSNRVEQHATGQRGPHRQDSGDSVGRGRQAGANSPLDPKSQADRGTAPEQRGSPSSS